MLEQFVGVFSEHMKQQMLSELSMKLASSTQAVAYKEFKKLQANNIVGKHFDSNNSIFQNKYLSMICYVPGRMVGEVQEPGALSVEFDGTFHGIKTDRFYDELARPEMQFSSQQGIKDGELLIYLGKIAFDSLLTSMFKGEGSIPLMIESLSMTVTKLDDMASGFENAFKEKDIVQITAQVDDIHSVVFDQQFNNIPFKAEFTVFFSNPINANFQSAEAKVIFKGIGSLELSEDFKLIFVI